MRALSTYKNIVVMTGAGISRSAGLATYRGPGGLWTDEEKAKLSDVTALRARRTDVCSMFWAFRNAIVTAKPTAAHSALAAFAERLPKTASFTLLTQNVDGLHQLAGSRDVCELHGTLRRWRCEKCSREVTPPDGDLPRCCDQVMRPSVTLFGEQLPVHAEQTMKRALRDCDLFVGIGTSGTVEPAASLVRWATLNHARTILVNLEIDPAAHDDYAQTHEGPADDIVPTLFV